MNNNIISDNGQIETIETNKSNADNIDASMLLLDITDDEIKRLQIAMEKRDTKGQQDNSFEEKEVNETVNPIDHASPIETKPRNMTNYKYAPETCSLGLGYNPKLTVHKSIKPPLYLSSTFVFDSAEIGKEAFECVYGLNGKQATNSTPMIYSRVTNPNIILYEQRLANWDKMKHCLLFSSGMSAISTLAFSILKPGDHCIINRPVYGGTDLLFSNILPSFGINTHWIEGGDNFIKDLNKLINEKQFVNNKNKIKLIYIETPSNPSIVHTDIKSISELIKNKHLIDCYLAVDNTLLGPKFQIPSQLGADIVLYSATKYLGGQCDLIAGAISCNDEYLFKQFTLYRTICGGISQPFVSWLLLRSLSTLSIRMEKQCKNAIECAKLLSKHKCVKKVNYPSLLNKNSNQYKIYKKQCYGPGGLISFDIYGNEKDAFNILNKFKVFSLAVSLGGTKSLVEHPMTMTHADVDKNILKKYGVNQSTIRLSIGIEHVDDLKRDLAQALDLIN
eukprot:432395_1